MYYIQEETGEIDLFIKFSVKLFPELPYFSVTRQLFKKEKQHKTFIYILWTVCIEYLYTLHSTQ